MFYFSFSDRKLPFRHKEKLSTWEATPCTAPLDLEQISWFLPSRPRAAQEWESLFILREVCNPQDWFHSPGKGSTEFHLPVDRLLLLKFHPLLPLFAHLLYLLKSKKNKINRNLYHITEAKLSSILWNIFWHYDSHYGINYSFLCYKVS